MNAELQGRDPRMWRISNVVEIQRFFNALGKYVIYFGGYGELGYENRENVAQIMNEVLRERLPSGVVVHTGTLLRRDGHAGIAEVYSTARSLGIETTGIYPSIAMSFADTHHVSPYCDHVFFVEDRSWGGFLTDGSRVSPTLSVHLAVSNELVMIGGGQHAADELKAFISAEKPVRFFAADMNHATTRQWSNNTGAGIKDMRGAAHNFWHSITKMRES